MNGRILDRNIGNRTGSEHFEGIRDRRRWEGGWVWRAVPQRHVAIVSGVCPGSKVRRLQTRMSVPITSGVLPSHHTLNKFNCRISVVMYFDIQSKF